MEDNLEEMLTLLNQQSLRISEQQEMIQKLTDDLQKKESMLSEALQTAEQLKVKMTDNQLIKQENDHLKQQVNESESKILQIKHDCQKEIMRIRQNNILSDNSVRCRSNSKTTALGKLILSICVVQISLTILLVCMIAFMMIG